MTWTYTNDPTNVPRDAVRVLCGDVDFEEPLITDEEVTFLLSEEGDNVYRAASRAARMCAAIFARKVTQNVGDLQVAYSDRRESYEKVADDLARRANLYGAEPYAGGISRTDKQINENDTDRVDPLFKREQFNYPGTTYDRERLDDDY